MAANEQLSHGLLAWVRDHKPCPYRTTLALCAVSASPATPSRTRNATHPTTLTSNNNILDTFGLLCWCGPTGVVLWHARRDCGSAHRRQRAVLHRVKNVCDCHAHCRARQSWHIALTSSNCPLCHVQRRPRHSIFGGAKGRIDTPLFCSSSAHSFKGRRFVYCATAADRFRSIVLACEGEESLCLTSRPFGHPPPHAHHTKRLLLLGR